MNKYFQVSCNNIKNCKNGGKTIIDLKDGPGSDPYRCECPKEYPGDLCDKFGKIYREAVNLTLFTNLCLNSLLHEQEDVVETTSNLILKGIHMNSVTNFVHRISKKKDVKSSKLFIC
jgi:hypothetical protein